MPLVSLDHLHRAETAIRDAVVRTPLLPCPWARPDRPLWLKPENLQPVGAFKIRGACYAVGNIPAPQRQRGVVAYSSGNHAQAVAFAAHRFGVPATIVIEETAPRVKLDATRRWGAEVVTVPGTEREATADRLVAERGGTLVPPFDHPDVIAGQGTIGLEIAGDLPDVDTVLVPVSGGGLISGIAVAVRALCPRAAVYAVEPELAADTAAGLRAGEQVHWAPRERARTIADGLRSEPSALTFEHLHKLVDGAVTVSEAQIRDAMRVLLRDSRLVAEPSGAVAVAAHLYRADELPAGNTVAVVSGGNADPDLLRAVLADEPGSG